jgi:DnaJ-class molecular chaperone
VPQDPFSLLGLEPTASPAHVRLAFLQKAKTAHPDAGGTAEEFAALRRAEREALALARETPCEECEGTGTVEIRRGFSAMSMRCGICGGTGRKWG